MSRPPADPPARAASNWLPQVLVNLGSMEPEEQKPCATRSIVGKGGGGRQTVAGRDADGGARSPRAPDARAARVRQPQVYVMDMMADISIDDACAMPARGGECVITQQQAAGGDAGGGAGGPPAPETQLGDAEVASSEIRNSERAPQLAWRFTRDVAADWARRRPFLWHHRVRAGKAAGTREALAAAHMQTITCIECACLVDLQAARAAARRADRDDLAGADGCFRCGSGRRRPKRVAERQRRLAEAVLEGRRCLVQRPKGAEGRLELYKLPAAEARAAVHLALALLERPR